MAGKWNKRNEDYGVPLTKEEETKYIEAARQGDLEARETLITRNLRLVRYIAENFKSTGIDVDELESIGNIGLIKGVDTFKLGKKTSLGTYIYACIKNEILMFLKRNRKKNAREISIETVVESYGDEKKITIKDVICDESADLNKMLDKICEKEDVQRIIQYILNKVNGRKKIFILYHLAGHQTNKIAAKYKISASYIRREIKSIKKVLRRRLRNNKQYDYNQYKVTIDNKMYKISFTIDEQEKYQLCKNIILKSNYKVYYNDSKRKVSILIDAGYKGLEVLIKIIESIEDIK